MAVHGRDDMTELFPKEILQQASRLVAGCTSCGLSVATAESCTGGLIAGAITEIAGASDIFYRGFITYSNEAKIDMLGVSQAVLNGHGAVSEAVARAMAEGAVASSGSALGIAVTGIAGPGGGTSEKPVGLVHIACAQRGQPTLHLSKIFPGDRTAIRLSTVAAALDLALKRIW
jgi:nicotinamide-nucleotide amidase